MHCRTLSVLMIMATAGAGSYSAAADDASLGKDLAATIALQGMPCDKVVDSKRNADSDYTASCKNGNRYHVYLDSTGRVLVKKL